MTHGARQLVLLEPRPIHVTGHYLSYIEAIAREAAGRGGSARLLTHRDIEPAALARLEDADVPVALPFHPPPAALRRPSRRWISTNLQGARSLAGLLRRAGPETLVLALSAEWTHLLGIEAATRLFPPGRPLIFQFFDATHLARALSRKNARGRVLRATRGAVQRMHHRRSLRLCAHGEPVAGEISGLMGVPVRSAPMLIPWPEVRRPEPEGLPRVSFVGEIREEKGFDQLIAALPLVERTYRLDALLSPAAGRMGPEEFEHRLRGLRSHPCATLCTDRLSQRDYLARVARADVVVLPYRPEAYRLRSSNILTEAIGFEAVPVLPRETWMGRLVERLGVGVAYAPYDPAGLAGAIDTALERLPQLRRRLREIAPRWRAETSADRVLDFFEGLAGLPDRPRPPAAAPGEADPLSPGPGRR